MRILITGYKGFIGQNMVKALPDHDLDLCEWGDDYSLYGIDRVIHLGAISDTRCDDWVALRKQNVGYSITLMERCQEYEIPIQLASSASVYGPDNTTFKETDPVAPANLYAESKALIERYFHEMRPIAPVQIFRYFNVYGPHEDHKGDQASPFHKFCEQAKDFIHVDEVIKIHKRFFKVQDSGIWNVGSGHTMSFFDIARLASYEFSAKIETIPMPSLNGYQKYTRADMTKLNRTLK
jgi:ADP-L-glycero-D-manno-heptose 6-epimerase